jgi:hypothetical protein
MFPAALPLGVATDIFTAPSLSFFFHSRTQKVHFCTTPFLFSPSSTPTGPTRSSIVSSYTPSMQVQCIQTHALRCTFFQCEWILLLLT